MSYAYDAMGRRISKAVGSGTPTQYLYDGANAVQETVGATVNPILVGLGIDERFARNDTTGRTYFLSDAINSTIALTNSGGAIQNTYSYDPYGNATQSGTGFTNPYQYSGREADTAGLYYYRARYYSPMMVGFISEDPARFAGGQLSFYAYVRGNPLLYTDPYGLAVQAVIGLGGTLIVPGTGGGVSLNLGVNFDWWNSSVYLQAQGNLGAPAAGGYFVGAGGNFEFADAAAPTTGLDSAPYWEADVGVLGGLGAFGSPDDCGNLNLGAMRGTKGGFAVGGGIYSGTTNTATIVSPTLGQMMSAFNNFAPDGGI